VTRVCVTETLAGPRAPAEGPPDLLIEVPHGATERAHYDAVRGTLRGDYADDLVRFFWVNTDVGAPEAAVAIARRLLDARPTARVRILRGLVPRTFVDCNREPETTADADQGITRWLPDYVTDPVDGETLRAYHAAYVDEARRAFEETCGHGGRALILHSYAPRSVRIVDIDAGIVAALRDAWSPDRAASWPRRPDVEMITAPQQGASLAPREWVDAVRAEYARIGVEVAENVTYKLYPKTLGYRWASAYPGQVLCVELNRERLVETWTPLEPLVVDPERVRAFIAPLAGALASRLGNENLT